MKKDLTLVIGASGTVGSGVIELLQKAGEDVRLATSRAALPNEREKVRLDLKTGEGITAAFEGVTKAFLLSPPGIADQHLVLSPLIQEAKRRGLKKVVLMTAMGADASDEAPFRRAELELIHSGLAYNIIRPNWFLQNFHTFWLRDINEQGKILLPAGNAKVSFIDARDISAVAARSLTSGEFANTALDLTGPEAVDHAEVAAAIGKATGRKISYEEISPEAFRTGLLKAGLPADYVDFMLLIMGFLREGYAARTTTNVQKTLGREPIPLEQYARDHREKWI